MNSKPTPYTHVGETTEELNVEFGPGRIKHTATVPVGTRCIKLDGGDTPWVVDDLGFIKEKSGIEYHDADHYGIRVPESKLTNIRAV